MKCLLDTHTFLWSATGPEHLSTRVRALLEDASNEALLSHVSAWEIAIKVAAGKIRVDGGVTEFVPRQMANHRFSGLAIDLAHVLALANLPLLHGDPFDRLLVCQAQIENLPILTADPAIARYSVQVIW